MSNISVIHIKRYYKKNLKQENDFYRGKKMKFKHK